MLNFLYLLLLIFILDMRVEVKEAPKICLGKKGPEKNVNHKFNTATVYNRKLNMDITLGELFRSPYHYVRVVSTVSLSYRSHINAICIENIIS